MAKETDLRLRLELGDKDLMIRAAREVHSELDVSKWARGVLKAEALRVLGLSEGAITDADALAAKRMLESVGKTTTDGFPVISNEPTPDVTEEKPSTELSHSEVAKTTSDNLPAFDNKDKVTDTLLVTSTDAPSKPIYAKSVIEDLLKNNPKLQMLNKEGVVEEPEGEPEYEYEPEDHEVIAAKHKGLPIDCKEKGFVRGVHGVYFNLGGVVYKAVMKPETRVCLAYWNGAWHQVASANWGTKQGSITVTKK